MSVFGVEFIQGCPQETQRALARADLTLADITGPFDLLARTYPVAIPLQIKGRPKFNGGDYRIECEWRENLVMSVGREFQLEIHLSPHCLVLKKCHVNEAPKRTGLGLQSLEISACIADRLNTEIEITAGQDGIGAWLKHGAHLSKKDLNQAFAKASDLGIMTKKICAAFKTNSFAALCTDDKGEFEDVVSVLDAGWSGFWSRDDVRKIAARAREKLAL